MKRTFLLLLCFTSFISAQSIPTKSVMELKNSAKEIKPADNLPLLTADQTAEKKSAFLAVVYSVLLPGMGELYAGNYDRGKYAGVLLRVLGFMAVGRKTIINRLLQLMVKWIWMRRAPNILPI
jgi:hypothetical protein